MSPSVWRCRNRGCLLWNQTTDVYFGTGGMCCILCEKRAHLEGTDPRIDPDRVATVVEGMADEVKTQIIEEAPTVQVKPPEGLRAQAQAKLQQARVVVHTICLCHDAVYEGGRCVRCGNIPPPQPVM